MTHENRLIHRRDVETGAIDKNPYPADLKPEVLELDKAIDHLTKPVRNEKTGEPVMGPSREHKYPTFSIHGKTGNFHSDRDGTYRFVNCTLHSVTYDTPATMIFINCHIGSISGTLKNANARPRSQVRISLIDSNLERVENADNFYMTLHGRTTWNGGMYQCDHSNVRMLQTKDWLAEDNIVECEDLTISFSMTEGAKVIPVGPYFARQCKRLRFHWISTDLVFNDPESAAFVECEDMLSQHQGCQIVLGKALTWDSKNMGMVLHSCELLTKKWVFQKTVNPVLTAVGSTLTSEYKDGEGGVFTNDCDKVRLHLGAHTSCNMGQLVMGSKGALTMAKARVSTKGTIIDAKDSSISIQKGLLEMSQGGPAIKLENSTLSAVESSLKSAGSLFELKDCNISVTGGKGEAAAAGLKLDNCVSAVRGYDVVSAGPNIEAERGSLVLEGGSTSMGVSAKNMASVSATGLSVGTDITVEGAGSVDLYGNVVAGNVTVQAGVYKGGGNTVAGSGTIDAGFTTMGGDTFAGGLALTGIALIGNVNAADVTNTGFMILEGGSGSSLLPNMKRGWHVSGDMEYVVDGNMRYTVGQNIEYVIGADSTETIGANKTVTAGGALTSTAATIHDN